MFGVFYEDVYLPVFSVLHVLICMQLFVHLATTRLWWVHIGTLSCLSVHEVRLSSQCGADVIFVFAAGYARMLL